MDIPLHFPKPGYAFLDELAERARRYGWDGGDYIEVVNFVRDLYRQAGIQIPAEELDPYEKIYDETGNNVIELRRP